MSKECINSSLAPAEAKVWGLGLGYGGPKTNYSYKENDHIFKYILWRIYYMIKLMCFRNEKNTKYTNLLMFRTACGPCLDILKSIHINKIFLYFVKPLTLSYFFSFCYTKTQVNMLTCENFIQWCQIHLGLFGVSNKRKLHAPLLNHNIIQ